MLLVAHNIEKTYGDGAVPLQVLTGVDFRVHMGEMVGIYGASGSGKSTLLHILGGLDSADKGSIHFEGQELQKMNEKQLAGLRNKKIGFVFQFYYLLPEFTALENVMLPALIGGRRKWEAIDLAREMLQAFGVEKRAAHLPSELSGGEQQRVALARAVVMKPKLILADEPTGNLDRETGKIVFDYLLRLNREHKIGMVVVSHNAELLKQIPRRVELRDGKLHGM